MILGEISTKTRPMRLFGYRFPNQGFKSRPMMPRAEETLRAIASVSTLSKDHKSMGTAPVAPSLAS